MSAGLPLRFSVPRGFVPIDLTAVPAQRAQELRMHLHRVSPGTSESRVAHLVAELQDMVEAMVAGGVGYAATCLARTERPPQVLTAALFAVVALDVPLGAAGALEAAQRLLDAPGAGRRAAVVGLPAGRALAVMAEQRVRRAATVFGDSAPAESRVRQVQLVLPLPGGSAAAAFVLVTTSVEAFDDWAAVLAGIVRTAGFDTGSSRVSTALGTGPTQEP